MFQQTKQAGAAANVDTSCMRKGSSDGGSSDGGPT